MQSGVDKSKLTAPKFRPAAKQVTFGTVDGEGTKSAKYTKEELAPIRQSLPIYTFRDALVEAVKTHRSVIVVGETGSGKTTQIPQYLLEDGLAGPEGCIAVTQPRRVAAMTLADRVAQEVGTELGDSVGYTIRFDDKSSENTRIKFVTDGMLLREIQQDPMLWRYKIVVLDEAHERTLNTDVLFGLLKQLQEKRKDLILVVMSATLDAGKFSNYLNGAPVALVPGRTFPVDILYLDPDEEVNETNEAVCTTVMQIHQEQPADGDILVFLPGSEDILAIQQVLQERSLLLDSNTYPQLDIYPLYSTMDPEQQLLAFNPRQHGTRKVILSTNIAETSVTVPGVRYVIDTGLSKVKQYTPSTGASTLQNSIISRAEAQQRAGRAGREQHGYCYRLYRESVFEETMEATPIPEILRSSISSCILQLKVLNVDIHTFSLLDTPTIDSIKQGYKELYCFGAIDSTGNITSLGRLMAALPVEPVFARMLVLSARPDLIIDPNMDPTKQKQQQQQASTQDTSQMTKSQAKKLRKSLGDITSLSKEHNINESSQHVDILPFMHCSRDMCILIAALSVDSLLITIQNTSTTHILRSKVELIHREFISEYGDMHTAYNVLKTYLDVPDIKRIKWCKEHYATYRNLTMAAKTYYQLCELIEKAQLPLISYSAPTMVTNNNNKDNSNTSSSHDIYRADLEHVSGTQRKQQADINLAKAIACGIFRNRVDINADGHYMDATEHKRVYVHPSSTLHYFIQKERKRWQDYRASKSKSKNNTTGGPSSSGNMGDKGSQQPSSNNNTAGAQHYDSYKDFTIYKSFLYFEIVTTKQRYMRQICHIDPDWLPLVAPLWIKQAEAHSSVVMTSQSSVIQHDKRHTHDEKESHINRAWFGQRSGFANLTSQKLSHSIGLGTGEKARNITHTVITKNTNNATTSNNKPKNKPIPQTVVSPPPPTKRPRGPDDDDTTTPIASEPSPAQHKSNHTAKKQKQSSSEIKGRGGGAVVLNLNQRAVSLKKRR